MIREIASTNGTARELAERLATPIETLFNCRYLLEASNNDPEKNRAILSTFDEALDSMCALVRSCLQ